MAPCPHKWLVTAADKVPVGKPLRAVCQLCGARRTYPKTLTRQDGFGAARPGRRGAANPMAKLTDEQVRQILTWPMGCRRLAAHFAVAPKIIRGIRAGTMWKHVRRPRGYSYRQRKPEPRPGEMNPASKLTAKAVQRIRNSKLSGAREAARYRVNRSTIHRLRTGKTWGHLTAEP